MDNLVNIINSMELWVSICHPGRGRLSWGGIIFCSYFIQKNNQIIYPLFGNMNIMFFCIFPLRLA